MAEKQIIYSNITNVNFGLHDFQIGFGIKKNRSVKAPPGPEDIDCFILMSPQQAKAFSLALTRAVAIYEDVFGEINLKQNDEALKKYSLENENADVIIEE